MSEVFHGWRSFSIVDEATDLSLIGSRGHTWATGTETAACYLDAYPAMHCLGDPEREWTRHPIEPSLRELVARGYMPEHEARTFLCGIYSMKRPPRRSGGALPNVMVAQVVSWGTVEEHEWGYRAEHCRIEALEWLVEETPWARIKADYLAQKYDAPVTMLTVEEYHQRHGIEPEPEDDIVLTTPRLIWPTLLSSQSVFIGGTTWNVLSASADADTPQQSQSDDARRSASTSAPTQASPNPSAPRLSRRRNRLLRFLSGSR